MLLRAEYTAQCSAEEKIELKTKSTTQPHTVFPGINAPGVYFKIRDFMGRSFEGRLFQNFKNSGNRIWTYKIRKHPWPVLMLFALRHVNKLLPYLRKSAETNKKGFVMISMESEIV